MEKKLRLIKFFHTGTFGNTLVWLMVRMSMTCTRLTTIHGIIISQTSFHLLFMEHWRMFKILMLREPLMLLLLKASLLILFLLLKECMMVKIKCLPRLYNSKSSLVRMLQLEIQLSLLHWEL